MAEAPTNFTGVRPLPDLGQASAVGAARLSRSKEFENLVKVVLAVAVVALLICGLVWSYASNARPGTADRIILAAALVAPALYFSCANPTLLLDHFLTIVVINRLVRRLMDWGEGRYDPLPVISLLPLFVAALMLIGIFQNWHQLPAAMKRASAMLAAGLGYAFVLGFLSYGLPAAYAFAEYVTPLIVLYYAVSCRPSAAVQQRWIVVLATLGVLASVYGILQWFDVPPWDTAWLMWSGMFSSQGGTQAFGMSIMSTLESRGPASIFFAVIAAAFVALPILRRRGGVVLGVLPVIALLLTTARTGLIYLVLTLLITSVMSRGAAGFKIVVTLVIIGIGAAMLLGRQSESTRIFDRVATLTNMENDGSASTRVLIAQQGISRVLATPQGFGFGAGGNASRAGTNEQDAVSDNGYLELLTTLGLPGALFYFSGLLTITQRAFRDRSRLPTGTEPAAHLGFGLALALVPVLVVGNCLITAHASYLWILLSRHLAAAQTASRTPARAPRRSTGRRGLASRPAAFASADVSR